MSAFISDKSLMTITSFMASKQLNADEAEALEECYRGLKGSAKPSATLEECKAALQGDHIVDANKMVETPEDQAAKNQPAVDLLTEWIQRPATEKEREAWEAFEKLVEESEPDETPEEAAERYAEDHAIRTDGGGYEETTDYKEQIDAFLAGVRWAEERSKK